MKKIGIIGLKKRQIATVHCSVWFRSRYFPPLDGPGIHFSVCFLSKEAERFSPIWHGYMYQYWTHISKEKTPCIYIRYGLGISVYWLHQNSGAFINSQKNNKYLHWSTSSSFVDVLHNVLQVGIMPIFFISILKNRRLLADTTFS